MVRQHTVYCGVYPVAAVRDVLLDVFGGSEGGPRRPGERGQRAAGLRGHGRGAAGPGLPGLLRVRLGGGAQPQSRAPGARGWLDGFDEAAAACERVVLGVGDGELCIVDVAPGARSRPFAGLVCEIAMGAVGGALSATLGPVLGDLAAGALFGAADAVSGGRAADPSPAEAGRTRTAAPTTRGGEAPPRLGDKPLTVRDLSAVTRWVTEHFGVGDDLRPEAIRVQTRTVARRKAGRSGGTDFLNSFIAADLSLVSRPPRHRGAGSGPERLSDRFDRSGRAHQGRSQGEPGRGAERRTACAPAALLAGPRRRNIPWC